MSPRTRRAAQAEQPPPRRVRPPPRIRLRFTNPSIQPPPRPQAVLDIQCYPHLLDMIISFAPPKSLLVLRRCSSTLRAQVDRHLFHHVLVVFPDPLPPRQVEIERTVSPSCSRRLRSKVTVLARPATVAVRPSGSNLTFEWLYDADRAITDDDSDEREDAEARALSRAYIDRQVATASLVDVWRKDLKSTTRALQEALKHRLNVPKGFPRTVRDFRTDNEPELEPEDEDDEEAGEGDGGWGGEGDSGGGGPPIVAGGAVSETEASHRDGVGLARDLHWRYVVAMLCRPGGRTRKFKHIDMTQNREIAPQPRFPEDVEDVEWIIHLLQDHASSGKEENSGKEEKASATAPLPLRLFRTPLEHWAGEGQEPFVTIVGGAEECRHAFGLAVDASTEEVDDKFFAALCTRFHKPLGGDYEAFCRKHIRFITPAEHEAEVGARQVALETRVEPFAAGPKVEYLD